jgi:hypothetical protein
LLLLPVAVAADAGLVVVVANTNKRANIHDLQLI